MCCCHWLWCSIKHYRFSIQTILHCVNVPCDKHRNMMRNNMKKWESHSDGPIRWNEMELYTHCTSLPECKWASRQKKSAVASKTLWNRVNSEQLTRHKLKQFLCFALNFFFPFLLLLHFTCQTLSRKITHTLACIHIKNNVIELKFYACVCVRARVPEFL